MSPLGGWLAGSVGLAGGCPVRFGGHAPLQLAPPPPLGATQPTAAPAPAAPRSEVQELLTLAAALGLPAPLQTVEEQLVAAHGDWDAAQAALEALAASSAAASNSDWGGWEQLGASRAASEEPSVNGPAGWEQQQPGPSPAPSLPATPSFNGAPQPPYDTPPRGSATPSAHLAHAASSASWQQGGASASDCDAASAGQPPASWAAPEPPSLPVPQPLQAAGQPSAGYPPAPPAGAPLGSPLPQPAPAVHAGFKDGFQAGLAYTDGYQAGLAAAMAALQQPSAAPGPHSGYAEPQAQLAGGGALPDPAAFFPAAGAAPGWEHAQAPAQHAQAGLLAVPPHLQPPAGKPDAELDDLLGMLGIA